MSGIFGIFNTDGQAINQVDLDRMSQVMAHRGPDGRGVVLDGAIGLGQLMLCSTAESVHEKLPWKDSLSGVVITADARIDNRSELLAALDLHSHSDKDMPDSQLILAAFRKWGEACVDHLLGDFAFAIWDAASQRLFCARDHMGLRPFYYFHSSSVFVFASAATAVVAPACVPRQIDQGRVADFLVGELEGINKTCAFFKDVYRMPPAHCAVLTRQNMSMRQYWELNPELELKLETDEEYADALEEVLSRAVKARLRSHKPVASMLSGGVDSSTICGIARRFCQESGSGLFRTYSGVSDDETDCGESSYIRKMIDHGGLDPYLLRPSDIKTFVTDLNRIEEHIEDPFGTDWVCLRLIYQAAHSDGTAVVLDGIDGDGIAGLPGSYPSYLMRNGHFKQALQEIRGKGAFYNVAPYNRPLAYLKTIKSVLTPNLARRLLKNHRLNNWTGQAIEEAMLSKEFAANLNLKERYREEASQATWGFCPTLRQAHAERISMPYITAAIERYTRLAASCGVEARQPYNDKRVVEFFLSLPWQQKNRHGWTKSALRRVLERVAPKQVAWRNDPGETYSKFNQPWVELNKKGHMDIMSKHRAKLENVVDWENINKLANQHDSAKYYEAYPFWNTAVLLRWLETHG